MEAEFTSPELNYWTSREGFSIDLRGDGREPPVVYRAGEVHLEIPTELLSDAGKMGVRLYFTGAAHRNAVISGDKFDVIRGQLRRFFDSRGIWAELV